MKSDDSKVVKMDESKEMDEAKEMDEMKHDMDEAKEMDEAEKMDEVDLDELLKELEGLEEEDSVEERLGTINDPIGDYEHGNLAEDSEDGDVSVFYFFPHSNACVFDFYFKYYIGVP